MNLTNKTFNGLKWSTLASVLSALMQIGYTALMARLLDPKAFGLVAMAGVFLRFATYFSNMGMGQAIIQKTDLSKNDIKAAFTSSLLLGGFFGIIIWLTAPLGGLLFDSENVVPIIKVLSLAFVFSGLSITSDSLLKRKMNFKSTSFIEIGSYVLGFGGVGVISALNGLGVWSLVFANLSRSFFTAVFSYALVRHPLSISFKLENYKKLFGYGSKISVISFFEFIGQSLDTLIIGRIKGANLLGTYNRALTVGQLPMTYISDSLAKVLFPAFSSIQSNVKRLKQSFLSSISLASYILIPIGIGMSFASEEIILTVLGPQWTDSIPLFEILAFAIPIKFLSKFSGILMDSTARLKGKLIFQIIWVIGLLGAFLLIKNEELIYFTYVLLGFLFIRNIFYLLLVQKILHFSAKEIISAHFPAILTGLVIGLLITLLKLLLEPLALNVIIELIILVVFAAISWFSMIFIKPNSSVRIEILNKLNKIDFFRNSALYKYLLKNMSYISR